MQLYNVLVKKNSEEKIEDIVLIKDGFSWLAFLFSGIWFFYYRMWKELFVLIAVNFAFIFFSKISSGFDRALLEIAFFFLVALNANYWRIDHLKKKKYEFIGLAFGNSRVDAKLRFVESFDGEFSEEILRPKIS